MNGLVSIIWRLPSDNVQHELRRRSLINMHERRRNRRETTKNNHAQRLTPFYIVPLPSDNQWEALKKKLYRCSLSIKRRNDKKIKRQQTWKSAAEVYCVAIRYPLYVLWYIFVVCLPIMYRITTQCNIAQASKLPALTISYPSKPLYNAVQNPNIIMSCPFTDARSFM